MSTLTVKFTNHSGLSAAVSIGFVPGAPPPGQSATAFDITNLKDQSSIQTLDNGSGTYPQAGTWYSLDDLSDGVSISSFSGRVYVCYGTPWALQRQGYEPGQAVTDPNFFLRYDKLEMTFTGQPSDVANLTSIDYWSIPITLNTSLGGALVQTVTGLLNGATAEAIYKALTGLTTPPVSGLAGPGGIDGAPLPALVPGTFQQFPGGSAPGKSFARIIGPSSYPPILPAPGAIPVQPYDLFDDYLDYLNKTFGPGTGTTTVSGLGNGVIAVIAGKFAGVGSPPPATGPQSAQTYDLQALISGSSGAYTITLQGTVSGVSGTTTMAYAYADLVNPTGIYGGNAPFTLNGASSTTTPANDVYGWIGGDLFSGFSIGAVGSQATTSAGGAVGALNSQEWFGLAPATFFSGLQSQSNYYNQWAATLSPLSNAYNFAFSDRFQAVFASLNPQTVDTLEIVLDDSSQVS